MRRFSLWAAVAVLILALGCEKASMNDVENNAGGENQMNEQALGVNTSSGTVATVSFGDKSFSVEIASDEESRAKGLMHRESIPENGGMWFAFDSKQSPEETKFWMKDTNIPLDLIFVDGSKKVVHIIEGAKPLSTDYLASEVPFQYVLEVNAGSAKGIKVGDEAVISVGN